MLEMFVHTMVVLGGWVGGSLQGVVAGLDDHCDSCVFIVLLINASI